MLTDREEIIEALVQACPFVDSCGLQCTPADHENCYGIYANMIIPLTDAAYKKGQEDKELEFHPDWLNFDRGVEAGRTLERESIEILGGVTYGKAPLKIKFFSIPWAVWEVYLKESK